MRALEVFKMPAVVKVTGRTSTITNSFVNSIIPVVMPTEAEVLEALSILGSSPDTIACAYCGGKTSEWDHLRPLVRDKRPTGFISEIANLVPACGKCNQSKSGQDWHQWIDGPAPQSPGSRGTLDLPERIARLKAFEAWRTPTWVDFQKIVPADLWQAHWDNLQKLHDAMRECQEVAERVRTEAARAIGD